MGVDELARHFADLPAHERALFAAMVRAHETFNSPKWRTELARRNRAVDSGKAVRVVNATEVLAQKIAAGTEPGSRPIP